MKVNVEAFINYKFKKIKLIKHSDKGEVWLATDEFGTIVILKKIFGVGMPYKFIKENPHSILPKIIYCAEDEKETIVVEEYIQGDNLFDRLNRKEYLTYDEARNIILQLCDGLSKLHSQGIIHRDIKPSNLILQGSNIKLIDFDIARIVKEDQSEDTRHLGTKGYAPPEQYGFGQTDNRSDIYTLGVTISNLLDNNYDGFLRKILEKCTELDPKHRYQSVEALKDAVLNYRQSKKFQKGYLIILILAAVFPIYFYLMNESKESEIEQVDTSVEEVENFNNNDSPSEKQKNIVADIQKSDNDFKFPDITVPTSSENPSNNVSKSKSVQKPTYQPPKLPNQSNFEPSNNSNIKEESSNNTTENIIDRPIENCVKVEYYSNGERLNAWVDNWDYDVTNAGTIQYIKANQWKSWLSNNNLNIPNGLVKLQARVKNYSNEPFYNPQFEVVYNDNERKILTGRTINPGEEFTFNIPFEGLHLSNSNFGSQQVPYVIKLNFSGSGAEIRGTSTEYELLFLKIGE